MDARRSFRRPTTRAKLTTKIPKFPHSGNFTRGKKKREKRRKKEKEGEKGAKC